MESAVAQAIAEATPLGGIAAPEAATPPEQAQTEVAAPQPEVVPQEEWVEVPDPDRPGETYTKIPKDPDKLARWLIERNGKFSEINRQKTALEAEVEVLRRYGQTPQQQPQVAPAVPGVDAPADPEVTARANELFGGYSRKYNAEPEQIWAAALRDAEVEINAERRVLATIEAREAKARNERIAQENPVLSSDFGERVFRKYGGRMTAETHLALVKLEALESGTDLSMYGMRPSLNAPAKAGVAASAAARAAALSTPSASAAAAPAASAPPNPALLAEYQNAVNSGNYSDADKAKLWTLMSERYNERRGA